MGWTFTTMTRKALIEDLLTNSNYEVLASRKPTTNHLWAVFKPTHTDGDPVLCLFMLAKSEGMWGYKDITESMGPTVIDCPVSLFDLAPVANAAWRERVRTAAKRAKATFATGDEVVVYGKRYTVTGTVKRSYLLRSHADGGTYKSTAKKMRLAAEVAAEKATREAELAAAPYMSISAFGDWADFVPEGMVGVKATKGANREGFGDTLHVLVPVATYAARNGSYILTGAETPWANHTAPAPKIVRTF
jgi:hypothetical protein